MEKPAVSVFCLALVAAACGSSSPAMNPVAPTATSVTSPVPPSPSPGCSTVLSSFPADPFSEPYQWIAPGEHVSGRFEADDPQCFGFHCRYFRLTPPNNGVLHVEMTYSLGQVKQPLDLSLSDAQSRIWWAPLCVGVTGGTTYQITVWYLTPGVEFELRTSLR
ncbi:MAG: hypothetical protein ACRD2N_09425 [Vicinamibacterales bacterium]